MLSYLTAHWRTTRLLALIVSLFAISVSATLVELGWERYLNVGFILIGSFILFAFGYSWPFAVRAIDLLNWRLMQRSRGVNHWGIKFFFWSGIVGLPLTILDSSIPLLTPNLALGVAACAGLVAGCCHALATQKNPSE